LASGGWAPAPAEDAQKKHLPCHESDHILNITHSILSGGNCQEDIELWRNDESYFNALGAQWDPWASVGVAAGIRNSLP
jgi:hypothetical protein